MRNNIKFDCGLLSSHNASLHVAAIKTQMIIISYL